MAKSRSQCRARRAFVIRNSDVLRAIWNKPIANPVGARRQPATTAKKA